MTRRQITALLLTGTLLACGDTSSTDPPPQGGFIDPDAGQTGGEADASPPDSGALDSSAPDSGALDSEAPFDVAPDTHEADVAPDAGPRPAPGGALGAHLDDEALTLRLFSERATRVEVWIYREAVEGEVGLRRELAREGDVWSLVVPRGDVREAIGDGPIYYGYRLWGPNWPWSEAWAPGTEEGFEADVDEAGNRFNPNKLALDPYALEMSHDPWTPERGDGRVYGSGEFRALDSGPYAPKGIVLAPEGVERSEAPTRPFRDEVIYEVHVRGLTRNDPSVPEAWRGTYRGAAEKAAWLRDLGVTAIELLPLHETPNARNDVAEGTDGDNYWGYSTLSYFAPDRRYAADRSPGGPTRELKAMVDAFHREGLKVYVDVVYNHTSEGGLWDREGDTAALLSWRAIDNHAYYQTHQGRWYLNHNGVGPDVGVCHPATRAMILDSLRYWHEGLGVDGFRFDLTTILGNDCSQPGGFHYNRDTGVLVEAAEALARPADGGPGVDLIAEPWGIGAGTYQVGNLPAGWAEWNDRYRDTLRDAQNRLGQAETTPGWLAARLHGSSDLYRDDGRQPWHSVNFLVAHDGFTLRDLYACNGKHNDQPWPYGPSDGGSDNNRGWDQGGAPEAQRQAARTGLALLMLSAGVPMITGGDEHLRSLRCNNNPYNLDSVANWLDWSPQEEQASFHRFARHMMRFRARHPALRPAAYTEGVDRDDDGVLDITWLTPSGQQAGGAFMDDPGNHLLAWRIDADEVGEDALRSIYVAWNRGDQAVRTEAPVPSDGQWWYRAVDTAAWLEGEDNAHEEGEEEALPGRIYDLAPRSLIVLVEKARR